MVMEDSHMNQEGGESYGIHGSSFSADILAGGDWRGFENTGAQIGSNEIQSQYNIDANVDPQLSNPGSTPQSGRNSPFQRLAPPHSLSMSSLSFFQPNRTLLLKEMPLARPPRAHISGKPGHPLSRQAIHPPLDPSQLYGSSYGNYSHPPSQGLATPGVAAFQSPPTFGDYGGHDSEASMHNPSSLPVTHVPYQNHILDSFHDLTVPLRVLDAFFHPFSGELVATLQQQLDSQSLVYVNSKLENLQREQTAGTWSNHLLPRGGSYSPQRRLSQQPYAAEKRKISNAISPAQATRSGTNTPGTSTPNSRATKIQQMDETKNHLYRPLAFPPQTWVSTAPDRDPTRFEYTIHGELLPRRQFSQQEMIDYIEYHPGHGNLSNDQYRQHSKLIIWIQCSPADSKLRYPDRDNSSRCRFSCCPIKKGTIRTGEFRVCFDEQPGYRWNIETDPYHNAGYAHLWCMEKNFNLHQIARDYRVLPDTRRLAETVNKMAITRDHPTMLGVIEEYMNRDPQISHDALPLDDDDWFKTTLTYALTLHHRNRMPEHTKNVRNNRMGFSLNTHMGDLRQRQKYNSLNTAQRKVYLANIYKNDPTVIDKLKFRSIKGVEEDEDEDDDDDETEDEEGDEEEDDLFPPSPKRKRQRRS